MALVAYDYASESDEETLEEHSTSSTAAVIIPPATKNLSSLEINKAPDIPESGSTFVTDQLSHLPKTKPDKQTIQEDTLEDFIPRYQPSIRTEKPPPKKVKITIPSLTQFDDVEDDEPVQKKSKTVSEMGSGLLSVLPPVRGALISTKSFVPHVLKNADKKPKGKPSPGGSTLVPSALRQKAELAKKAAIRKITQLSKGATNDSDLESDDDMELPESFDEEMWKKVCGPQKKVVREPKKEVLVSKQFVPEEVPPSQGIDIAPEPEQRYDGLDNEAFQKLVGKGKRPVNIKLIDINEDEVLPETDLWMTKNLTDPEQLAKPAVEEPVDNTKKKKHHITYLAEQAKASEQDFKTQWAASKYKRNQTRAKYGF